MSESRLYVIVREDMASMTPGRVAAQVAHAHGCAERALIKCKEWLEWKGDRGFGTTIVLSNFDDYYKVYLNFTDLGKELLKGSIVSGVVVDSTYPIKDGNTTHFVSVSTCMWVFVTDMDKCPNRLFELPLYPH